MRLPLGQRPPAPLRARRHGGQRRALRPTGVALLPLRRARGRAPARGCSRRSRSGACVVVTDDFPCFFLPRMVQAAARQARRAARGGRRQRAAAAARDRRAPSRPRTPSGVHLQKELRVAPGAGPQARPARARLAAPAPSAAAGRDHAALAGGDGRAARGRPARWLRDLPIDHAVAPVAVRAAAASRATRILARFLRQRLARYARGPQRPRRGRHERALALPALRPRRCPRGAASAWPRASGWSPDDVSRESRAAQRAGWWGTERRRPRPSSTSSSPGASSASTSATSARTTTATSRCPTGRCRRSAEHAATRRRLRLHARAARGARRPTTSCGTPPSGSCAARAASTTTCACCGARRSCEWSASPARGARGDDRAQQPVRARRPRPQLLQRHLLDARPLRPRLGPRARRSSARCAT